jgi:AdoMet-dependent heme synthase
VLVLTGGDPMMRRDLFKIADYAVKRGLRVSVSPTATALTTADRLSRLKEIGVAMVHVSLDGARAETHDAFRGFSGSYERTVSILRDLRHLGMSVQVGTTVTRRNAAELEAIADLMVENGIQMWNLFFLVPTGRGRSEDMVDVSTAEQIWSWMCELSERAPFGVRTTAAPQFRRAMVMRRRAEGGAPTRLTGAGYQLRGAPAGVETRGVNDGKGFMFIDHVGNIYPSGFLPVSAGNLRSHPIADIYRDSKVFRALRDPSAFVGRCGRCRFAELCGGSRARAYALTGSYLEDDPLCALED